MDRDLPLSRMAKAQRRSENPMQSTFLNQAGNIQSQDGEFQLIVLRPARLEMFTVLPRCLLRELLTSQTPTAVEGGTFKFVPTSEMKPRLKISKWKRPP